jgi:DNA-binding GntR family transcriptional regulator
VEQIATLLEQEILVGHIRPGQRLLETEIASRLGVSRAPVREALKQLQYDGLVTSATQRGAYVRPLSAADAWNLYILRAYISALAARLATPQCGEADTRKLGDIVHEMEVATRERDKVTFVSLHIEFMTVLARATGNEWIETILRILTKAIVRYGNFAFSVPGHFEQSLEGHRRTVDAIERGDAAAAEAHLRSMLEDAGHRVSGYLERQPPELHGSSHRERRAPQTAAAAPIPRRARMARGRRPKA